MSDDKTNNEIPEAFRNDKLYKYLEPFLGSTCSAAAIEMMEKQNPELKGNNELRDKFIKELDKVPDQDKHYMVCATIKLSKIREFLTANDYKSEYSDAYSNFENITTRLLKNMYDTGKNVENATRNCQSFDEVVKLMESPQKLIEQIIFNDYILKDKDYSMEDARKRMKDIAHSVGGICTEFKDIEKKETEKKKILSISKNKKGEEVSYAVTNDEEIERFHRGIKELVKQSAEQGTKQFNKTKLSKESTLKQLTAGGREY